MDEEKVRAEIEVRSFMVEKRLWSRPAQGVAAIVISFGMFIGGWNVGTWHETSTVGGTVVPAGLDCEEDEVIWWTGIDTLSCVHFENVR